MLMNLKPLKQNGTQLEIKLRVRDWKGEMIRAQRQPSGTRLSQPTALAVSPFKDAGITQPSGKVYVPNCRETSVNSMNLRPSFPTPEQLGEFGCFNFGGLHLKRPKHSFQYRFGRKVQPPDEYSKQTTH